MENAEIDGFNTSETMFNVPLIIRGQVIENADITHLGRGGGISFTAPDVGRHIAQLSLSNPGDLTDLYALCLDEIFDYLGELGNRLSLEGNPWVEEAFKASCHTSGLGESILRSMYNNMSRSLDPSALRETVEKTIGISHLEGWVESQLRGGVDVRIRAFGARCVHIVAGNAPGVSAMTVARNAITRGDAIIKTPSNDPMTAAAIARTMIEMAPGHPLTRHLSVAYWKGGDAAIEEKLYSYRNVEKIIAWGGMASIKHIAKYIQPGVELVALDPKLSSTIIGKQAFSDEETMRNVAVELAKDGGGLNQEACVNARVVWVESGTDDKGIAVLNRFGQMVYDEIQALPAEISSPAVRCDPKLEEEVVALKTGGDDWYRVIGGGRNGAVIVSQMDEPVDFAPILANRVINLVPFDDIDTPVHAVTSYTQTIGIYPETLKEELRDRLALQGAQRLVTLGYALAATTHGLQDAIEPWRRMCRWIVEERHKTG
jgi:hypothetical protein